MEFLVIQNSDLIFAKILPGRPLSSYLWSQLALTAKTAHFQGQTIPEAGKPPFYLFSCVIFHGLLSDLNSDIIFAKNVRGRPLRP